MGKLFLGKWWHWLLIIVFTCLLWQIGLQKMHVIQFNSFILLLLAGTVVSLWLLISRTPKGEQITREVLHEEPPQEPSITQER